MKNVLLIHHDELYAGQFHEKLTESGYDVQYFGHSTDYRVKALFQSEHDFPDIILEDSNDSVMGEEVLRKMIKVYGFKGPHIRFSRSTDGQYHGVRLDNRKNKTTVKEDKRLKGLHEIVSRVIKDLETLEDLSAA